MTGGDKQKLSGQNEIILTLTRGCAIRYPGKARPLRPPVNLQVKE